jgi:hypothetical protein
LVEVDRVWLERLARVSADASGAAVAPYSTRSALGAAAASALPLVVVLLLGSGEWWLRAATVAVALLVALWAAGQIVLGRKWDRLAAQWTAERARLLERIGPDDPPKT